MSNFKYEIQGVKLTQKPMKIKQIREFLKLVTTLDVGEKNSLQEVQAEEVIDLLLSEKVKDVALILFGKDAEKIEWDDVEYEQVEAIVQDFLSLNPSLAERLRSLFGFFGSMSIPAGSIPSLKSTAKK